MIDCIEPIRDLSEIDEEECLSGYLAGFGCKTPDYTKNSRSYWHGYHNGRADRGLEPPSPESRAIARQIVSVCRN
jgi:hypothetical protein